jgi:hypothetical protein
MQVDHFTPQPSKGQTGGEYLLPTNCIEKIVASFLGFASGTEKLYCTG